MQRILIRDLKQKIGDTVMVAGWVDVRRDHGKLIFVELRDASGKVQCVITPREAEAHHTAETVRPEWVLEIKGVVKKRPGELVNPKEPLGEIEIGVSRVLVLNSAEVPAVNIHTDGYEIGEEVRLRERFIDLRRERLQRNMLVRHKVIKFIRDFLDKLGFIEIETPLLTRSTPEGARDYVVPSRRERGKFYALPQSPQQYKQLLMTAGFERYFQIARCLRDEDTRGDRQPEFTQLDLEMSFVTREEIMALTEELLVALTAYCFPDKRIQEKPFPRLAFATSMERFGTDKPDLRGDREDPSLLAFSWITEYPFFEKTANGNWTFTHNPFSAPTEEHVRLLMDGRDLEKIITTQYDVVLNGFEIGGGSIRNHKPEVFLKVMEILGHSGEDVELKFGHMLRAFRSGTPPHGGIALGLDRLLAVLLGEPNIREVIAFPKTGEGRDPMMETPAELSDEQLRELGLQVRKK